MKTVFRSSELPHEWAHQTTSYGRCPSSTHFEGLNFYSYRTVIARLILKNGVPNAVLLTTRRYSNTTCKHMGCVRRAVTHLKQFHVDDVTSGHHPRQLADYRSRIKELAISAGRARQRKGWLLSQLDELLIEANAYCEYFKLKTRFETDIDVDAEWKKAKEIQRKETERQKRLAEERLQRARAAYPGELAKYNEDVQKWLDGNSDTCPRYKPVDPDTEPKDDYWPYYDAIKLRVRGSRIETSNGAVVEIKEATKLLPYVRTGQMGPLYDIMSIGPYGAPRFDSKERTVTIGCTTIAFDEIERIAKQLGL